MILLAIDEAEFLDVVSGINDIHKMYENEKTITYYTTAFIYKVDNCGFNNYLFNDKIINDNIPELDN